VESSQADGAAVVHGQSIEESKEIDDIEFEAYSLLKSNTKVSLAVVNKIVVCSLYRESTVLLYLPQSESFCRKYEEESLQAEENTVWSKANALKATFSKVSISLASERRPLFGL